MYHSRDHCIQFYGEAHLSERVVGLEEDGVLGVDDGILYQEVEIRLCACGGHRGKGHGSINVF